MKIKPSDKSGGVVVELSANEPQMPVAGVETAWPTAAVFRLKKILVPVDFSECSRKALQYALPFARQSGAGISLVYVLEPYLPIPEMTAVSVDLTRKQLLTTVKSELKALQQSIPHDIASQAVLREGSAYVEIVNVAKELKADLIVLSTHGRTGLAHVFMGSTAERVVRHAPCPVLVVREREHEFIPKLPAVSER